MRYSLLILSIGFLIAQTAAPAPPPSSPFSSGIPDYVAHTGLVGMVVWLWRQDRNDRANERGEAEKRYATERAEAERRYADLALDFRKIVSDNTQAMVSLREAVACSSECPIVQKTGSAHQR